MRLGALFLLGVRIAMAVVFISAAIPKIMAPDLFAGSVFNYQMLPAWGVNALALVLPWVELFTGICLATGLWTRASAVIMAGLMVVFMIAFASARSRGLDIACGCFEVGSKAKPSSEAWVLLRDSALLIGALILVRIPTSPLVLMRRLRPAAAAAAS